MAGPSDPADISGMPDPSTIGLSPQGQVDPTASMPEPKDLFQKYYGFAPPTQMALDDFMSRGLNKDTEYQPTLRKAASQLTGLPRAAAGVALSVPAGVASIAGELTGAGGAIVDPTNAANYLEQGRDRGRAWAAKVNNLANYVPATAGGSQMASALTSLPGNLIKENADATLGQVLPDNAYQAVSDVGQDIGTDLPALGAPAAVRGVAKGVGKAAGAVKAGIASEAATAVAPEPPPAAPLTPPVGEPITGNTLRAQPNPIPSPDGTLHQEVHPAALPPKEAPGETIPASQPAAAEAPTAPAEPTESPATQVTSQAPAAAEPQAAASAPPEPGNAPPPTSIEAAAATANDPFRFANGTMKGGAQRGSVRLFNSPADEGPKETPAPEEQGARAASLDAIDKLSGGALPTRRISALTGDYNATGDDWQMKEVGNEQMRQQVASENNALHKSAGTVHDSVGSEFGDSVDSQTLGDRGRVTRGAIQGIEGWFDKATDQTYDAARAANGGRPIASLQRVKSYLNDDSNFTNDAEIGLQRAAKQRLDRLWTTGDPDKGTPPGSVNAAERFREFLNEKGKNPNAMGVAKDLKNATDMDVAEHGGPGLFETARAMRRHSFQMLEEPAGIKKLLAPSDSQGINHAIPEHKVMDYIADLPREQHEHVLNVLRAGAHLGGGELAESSAAALREIQAHTISRIHAAATNADGSWNARKFYNASDRYARNMPDTFKSRPDVLNNLKTINDAGNTLAMDKHYPGAGAQIERTGALGHAVGAVGHAASALAHEVPFGGRMVGRAIEHATDKVTGQVSEAARNKAVAQRLVDRTGKQRGAVGDLSQRDQVESKSTTNCDGTVDRMYTFPGTSKMRPGKGGSMIAREYPERGVTQGMLAHVDDAQKGQGWGTRMLQRAVDDAHARGQVWHSDQQVSEGQAGAYKNLAQLGYDVKMKDNDIHGGARHAVGDQVLEVLPGKVKVPESQRGSVQLFNDNNLNRSAENDDNQRRGIGINPRNERNERVANQQMGGRRPLSDEQNDILNRLSGGNQRGSVRVMNGKEDGKGSTLNVGLHQGTEGEKGFRKMSKQEAQEAVESSGAKVTKNTVLTPKQHGVSEPTAVISTDRPLSDSEMQSVLAKTKQSAIPQRTDAGEESMHVAPGHEQVAKEQGWDKFNPDYFREHSGQTMPEAQANPKNIHPNSTVKDARRSAYPGIYDDPMDVVTRGETVPESPHLKEIFGTTRQQMHDEVVKRGDVEPKSPMPGLTPKGKGSAHAQQVTTPENAERVRNAISALKEAAPDAYRGMVSWYHMDPMYKSIKKILGGDSARAGTCSTSSTRTPRWRRRCRR